MVGERFYRTKHDMLLIEARLRVVEAAREWVTNADPRQDRAFLVALRNEVRNLEDIEQGRRTYG